MMTAHNRSFSRPSMSESCLPELASKRPRPPQTVDRLIDGTPSKQDKHSPPSSPRSNDPYQSISRAIHNVKVRTGARLSALAIKQRYARNNARHRSMYITAKAVTRAFFFVALILFTASLILEPRSNRANPASGVWALLRHGAGPLSGRRARENAVALDAMLRHRPAAETTRHFEKGPWVIATISDLDKESCRHQEKHNAPLKETSCAKANTWVSYYKRGILSFEPPSAKVGSPDPDKAQMEWLDEIEITAHGHFGTDKDGFQPSDGRGMELSELEWFNGHLLTPDDRTGTLFEIMSPRGILEKKAEEEFYGASSNVSPSTFQRAKLHDGPGDDTSAFFKSEWMVVKDGKLIIGGHGRSYTMPNDGTRITNNNPKWVKIIDKNFEVSHEDWSERYDRVAAAAGVVFPGYLMHEAVLWSEAKKMWVFLPRRVSHEPFDGVENEAKGARIAITATVDFETITYIEIEGLDDTSGLKGFSSAKFVPGTGDSAILALRTIEVENNVASERPRETGTYICAFEIPSGNRLIREQIFSSKKFEGLIFL